MPEQLNIGAVADKKFFFFKVSLVWYYVLLRYRQKGKSCVAMKQIKGLFIG